MCLYITIFFNMTKKIHNKNQLSIQKDLDVLREQWLRKDLWSLSELINLCCGSLDGTRPISPWAKKRFEEYEKRSKSQGTPVVSMPFDKSDLENERKEPATVAEEIIRRGIQSKALKITDRSAVDI